MEALHLHELCMWLVQIAEASGRSHQLTSLSAALEPEVLLCVLSQVIPKVENEPDIACVDGDPETLLTVYINSCRRFGMRCLYPAHAHPALVSEHSSSAAPSASAGLAETGSGQQQQPDMGAVLRNVLELRAIYDAKHGGSTDVVRVDGLLQHSDMRRNSSVIGIAGQPSSAAPSQGAQQVQRHHQSHSDHSAADPAAVPLTFAEHCSLYTGRVSSDVTPAGRERLWTWLLEHEPSCIRSLDSTRAQAVAASRRINEARRTAACSTSSDDKLVLHHMLQSPGHGLILVRRRLLRCLVRAGLPPPLRPRLWLAFTGASTRDSDAIAQFSSGAVLPPPRVMEAVSQAELIASQTALTVAQSQAAVTSPYLQPVPSPQLASLSQQQPSPSPLQLVADSLSLSPDSEHQQQPPSLLLYDRLILANACHLAPGEQPCHLRQYLAVAPHVVTVQPAVADAELAENAAAASEDGSTSTLGFSASPSQAASATPLSATPPPWLSDWMTATGIAPAPAKAVTVIDNDMRRTVNHLAPIERCRLHLIKEQLRRGDAFTGLPVDEDRQGEASDASGSAAVQGAAEEELVGVRWLGTSVAASLPASGRCQHTVCDCGGDANASASANTANACECYANSSATAWPGRCSGGIAPQFSVVQQLQQGPGRPAISAKSPLASAAVTVSIASIRRLLLAFASYCPTIGYCQGLNWLAAHLLRWYAEPDAFALLTLLVARRFPAHTHTDMSGAVCDQRLLGEIINTCLPQVTSHVAKLMGGGSGGGSGPSDTATAAAAASSGPGKPQRHASSSSHVSSRREPSIRDTSAATEMLVSATLKWFVCAFATPFPSCFTDRVWDCWISEGGGGKVIIRTALALVRLAAPRICAAKTFPDAMGVLDRLPEWCRHVRVHASLLDEWSWPPTQLLQLQAANALPTALRMPVSPRLRGGVAITDRTLQHLDIRRHVLSLDLQQQRGDVANHSGSRNDNSPFADSPTQSSDGDSGRARNQQHHQRRPHQSSRSPSDAPVTTTSLGLRVDKRQYGHGVSGTAVAWLLQQGPVGNTGGGNNRLSLTPGSIVSRSIDDAVMESCVGHLLASLDVPSPAQLVAISQRVMQTLAGSLPTDSSSPPVSMTPSATDATWPDAGADAAAASSHQDDVVGVVVDDGDDAGVLDDEADEEAEEDEEGEGAADDEGGSGGGGGGDDEEAAAGDASAVVDESPPTAESSSGDDATQPAGWVRVDGDVAAAAVDDVADAAVPAKPPSSTTPGVLSARASKAAPSYTTVSRYGQGAARRRHRQGSDGSTSTDAAVTSGTSSLPSSPALRGGGGASAPGGGDLSPQPSQVGAGPVGSPDSALGAPSPVAAGGLSQRALIARGLRAPAFPSLLPPVDVTMGLVWRERQHVGGGYVRSRRMYHMAQWREEQQLHADDGDDEDVGNDNNPPGESDNHDTAPRRGSVMPSWLTERLACADGERWPQPGDGRLQSYGSDHHGADNTSTTHASSGGRRGSTSDHHDRQQQRRYRSPAASAASAADLQIATGIVGDPTLGADGGIAADNDNDATAALVPQHRHGALSLPAHLSSPSRRVGQAMEVGAPVAEPFSKGHRLLSFFYRQPQPQPPASATSSTAPSAASLVQAYAPRPPYSLALIEGYWRGVDGYVYDDAGGEGGGWYYPGGDTTRCDHGGEGGEGVDGTGYNVDNDYGDDGEIIMPAVRLFPRGRAESTSAFRPVATGDGDAHDAAGSIGKRAHSNPASSSSASTSAGTRHGHPPTTTTASSSSASSSMFGYFMSSLASVTAAGKNGGDGGASHRKTRYTKTNPTVDWQWCLPLTLLGTTNVTPDYF